MMAMVTDGLSGPVVVEDEDPLALLYRQPYRSLVRLANVLLGDPARSEEIVQDAFVRLQVKWGGLPHLDRAPAYLRSAVLNGARSSLRHTKVVGRRGARRSVALDAPSAESSAMMSEDHLRMVAALRRLPHQQRTALALRYYLDLSYGEVADTMGALEIRVAAVTLHLVGVRVHGEDLVAAIA